MRRGWGRYRDAVAAPLGSGPNIRASNSAMVWSASIIGPMPSALSIAACRWQAACCSPALSSNANAIFIKDRAVLVSLKGYA
jgi:hypothetical protein